MTSDSSKRIKPTADDLQAARNTTLPDVLTDGLKLVFCGINPSLYSAAVGHHFGRPGNRFWKTLHQAGFTDRLLSPFEDEELLAGGYGITNLVSRATARADELAPDEFLRGARQLERKVKRHRPKAVAFVGITAYRTAFERPKAAIGQQAESIAQARIWVLPNTSGLNAHYQLPQLAEQFRKLCKAWG